MEQCHQIGCHDGRRIYISTTATAGHTGWGCASLFVTWVGACYGERRETALRQHNETEPMEMTCVTHHVKDAQTVTCQPTSSMRMLGYMNSISDKSSHLFFFVVVRNKAVFAPHHFFRYLLVVLSCTYYKCSLLKIWIFYDDGDKTHKSRFAGIVKCWTWL
jgi:hypothetical protein